MSVGSHAEAGRRSILVRLVRHPLVHFAIVGAALFALDRNARPREAMAEDGVVISSALSRSAHEDFVRRYRREPTPEEQRAALDGYVDEELLYREALAQGLDRDDVIVRRRLAQKMEFVYEDLEPIPDPTDRELETFRAAHRDQYREPPRVSLRQIFLSRDRHGDHLEADAQRLLSDVRRMGDPGTTSLGDPFIAGDRFAQRSTQDLDRIFGPGFAPAIFDLAAGAWSEPIASSYGLHLVKIEERTDGRDPALGEIRSVIAKDWSQEKRRLANRSFLDRLRKKYRVEIESAAPETKTAARDR